MSKKIQGLDGIRGLAAVTVVLTHLGIYDIMLRNAWISKSLLPMIHGGAGVHVFFVLSGFLITTLLIKEVNASGGISIKNFYIPRTIRIFPLYFLVVCLAGLMEYFGKAGVSSQSFLYALTYTYNFIPRSEYSGILGHTWSLAVEEHYYLLWPALFSLFFIGRRSILFLVAVLSILISGYLMSGVLASWNETYFVERWTMVAGGSIVIGSLSALMVNAGSFQRIFSETLKHKFSLMMAILIYIHSLFLGEHNYSFLVRAVGVAIFIVWLYENQSSVLVSMLEWLPLRYLGIVSYGIYMWQGFFLSTGPWRATGVTWPPGPTTGLLYLVLVVPLSYHFFEKPILRIKDKYSAVRERVDTSSRILKT